MSLVTLGESTFNATASVTIAASVSCNEEFERVFGISQQALREGFNTDGWRFKARILTLKSLTDVFRIRMKTIYSAMAASSPTTTEPLTYHVPVVVLDKNKQEVPCIFYCCVFFDTSGTPCRTTITYIPATGLSFQQQHTNSTAAPAATTAASSSSSV